MKKLITAIYVCYAKVCLQWNCTKSSFQAWELLPHMVYKGNVPLTGQHRFLSSLS